MVITRGLWTMPFCLCAICTLPGDLLAIPAPMSEARLRRMAHVVVDGNIVSTEYVRTQLEGRYRVRVYRSKLRITHVLKGSLKIGQSIMIYWNTETWIGSGRRPVGRSPQPAYYPCSIVRAYLKSRRRGYHTVYYNGKKLLRAPSRYVSPTARHRIVRCVQGTPR